MLSHLDLSCDAAESSNGLNDDANLPVRAACWAASDLGDGLADPGRTFAVPRRSSRQPAGFRRALPARRRASEC